MRALTPPGRAGVAVFRFEPAERGALVACLRGSRGVPFEPVDDRPVRAALTLPDGAEDDVLVLGLPGGGVEVHLHGAPAIAAAMFRCFRATPSSPLPAWQRLLRDAIGREQLALALEQSAFDFEAELVRLAALSPAARAVAVAAALERSRVAMALVEPIALHLIGRQNVGKSTLFNRLVGRDRVLAGPLAGLTRDAVAEPALLGGFPVLLWDHAGEGPATTAVDAAAIARSRRLRSDGLRILLVDAALGPTNIDRALAADADLVLASRADLAAAAWPVDVPCHGRCAPRLDDVVALRERIGALLRARRGLPLAGPVGGFAALDAGQRERLARLAPS